MFMLGRHSEDEIWSGNVLELAFKRSYFGKQNSTLGPLSMFKLDPIIVYTCIVTISLKALLKLEWCNKGTWAYSMISADVNANVDFLVNVDVNFLMSRGCAVCGEVA